MATFSTTTPLVASGTYDSPSVAINNGGTTITGTVFADHTGTLLVEQSFDGTHWDESTSFSVAANVGQGWSVAVVAPYAQLIYNNGSTPQTVFRLYGEIQDANGNIVSPNPPSSGGQFAVLQKTSNGSYTYVGRFDGQTAWDACGFAAVALNQSGTYAAFDVSTATVASEAVVKTATGAPGTF